MDRSARHTAARTVTLLRGIGGTSLGDLTPDQIAGVVGRIVAKETQSVPVDVARFQSSI